jgi:hypothetical protein
MAVDLTVEQAMAILQLQEFRCAVTRLPFWSDGADAFGPTLPSIDRIDPKGPYRVENVRIVLLGVNGLRGCGSDQDMYCMASALINNRAQARRLAKTAIAAISRQHKANDPQVAPVGYLTAAAKAAATRAKRDALDPVGARARYVAAAAKARRTAALA